jgi:hypothetical protein
LAELGDRPRYDHASPHDHASPRLCAPRSPAPVQEAA